LFNWFQEDLARKGQWGILKNGKNALGRKGGKKERKAKRTNPSLTGGGTTRWEERNTMTCRNWVHMSQVVGRKEKRREQKFKTHVKEVRERPQQVSNTAGTMSRKKGNGETIVSNLLWPLAK